MEMGDTWPRKEGVGVDNTIEKVTFNRHTSQIVIQKDYFQSFSLTPHLMDASSSVGLPLHPIPANNETKHSLDIQKPELCLF